MLCKKKCLYKKHTNGNYHKNNDKITFYESLKKTLWLLRKIAFIYKKNVKVFFYENFYENVLDFYFVEVMLSFFLRYL